VIFTLRLEASPGSDIRDAAESAARVSRQLGVLVTFDFNGVQVYVRLDDRPHDVVDAYHQALKDGSKWAFAKMPHLHPVVVPANPPEGA
jgi:sugar/nucleoside kinase (ribokinase family)